MCLWALWYLAQNNSVYVYLAWRVTVLLDYPQTALRVVIFLNISWTRYYHMTLLSKRQLYKTLNKVDVGLWDAFLGDVYSACTFPISVGSPYKIFGNSLHEESRTNSKSCDKIASAKVRRYKSQMCKRIMKLRSNSIKGNNVFLIANENIHIFRPTMMIIGRRPTLHRKYFTYIICMYCLVRV